MADLFGKVTGITLDYRTHHKNELTPVFAAGRCAPSGFVGHKLGQEVQGSFLGSKSTTPVEGGGKVVVKAATYSGIAGNTDYRISCDYIVLDNV